jgi:uncharacterized protein (TIGR03437 family)
MSLWPTRATTSRLLTGFMLFACCGGISAQPPSTIYPALDSRYDYLNLPRAAPGQLITVMAQGVSLLQRTQAPSGADLPERLGSMSATFGAPPYTPFPIPLFQVNPVQGGSFTTFRSSVAVSYVTVQVPYSSGIPSSYAAITLSNPNYTAVSYVPLLIVNDNIHLLTQCDGLVVSTGQLVRNSSIGCQPFVTHADGTVVWTQSPAKAGEQLVAYAVGLGQTNPPLTTGKLVTAAAPTQTKYTLDFNYRPNALATRPLPGAPEAIFAGATPGFVGLYQVNFVVPAPPPGTPPCLDTFRPQGNVIETNLTVTIAGNESFDAAGICVSVP